MLARIWNGRKIRQRVDGYLSLTDMAQACEKRVANWERLDSTQEYLKALELRRYSDVSNGNLIEIQQGGIPENQGTWGYRKVALRFAQWLSADFAVQVDEWIEELLLTGKVDIRSEQSTEAAEKYLIAWWKEQREKLKYERKLFTDAIQKHGGSSANYQKYTDMIYAYLFGTTAKKLRSYPVVDGKIQTARNHLSETTHLEMVAQVEFLVYLIYTGAVEQGMKASMSRAVVVSCFAVKYATNPPFLGSGQENKSRRKVIYQLIEDTRLDQFIFPG